MNIEMNGYRYDVAQAKLQLIHWLIRDCFYICFRSIIGQSVSQLAQRLPIIIHLLADLA